MHVAPALVYRPNNEIRLSQNPSLTSQEVSGTLFDRSYPPCPHARPLPLRPSGTTDKLSIHEAAEFEINEAADFYDIESPGLGNVLIAEIQPGIDSISQFPDAAPLIRGRARKKPLTKFPN